MAQQHGSVSSHAMRRRSTRICRSAPSTVAMGEEEQTIDQVQEVGSGVLDTAQRVAEAVGNVLKPGIETELPFVQQAGDEAFKFASPAFSEASKQAQEALQTSGVDSQSVLKLSCVVPIFARRCKDID